MCASKKEGHQEAAMWSNTMGGSQKNENYVIIQLKQRRDSLSSTQNTNTAFIDSGASGHYICEDAPVQKSKHQEHAISAGQSGGDVMISKYNCDLQLQSLPENAQKGHVLTGLHTLLLSVGKYYNEDFLTIFAQEKMHIYQPTPELINIVEAASANSALNGWQDHSNGLWQANIDNKNHIQ
eukprot:2423786-Ditylum_brightwellii.AAC.1